MKDYTDERPAFSKTIKVTEITDTNHADNINAAPKQLLANTLVLDANVKSVINPSFTENEGRVNINSGESLSGILGKVKKWYSDFADVTFSGLYSDLIGVPGKATQQNDGLMSKEDKKILDGAWDKSKTYTDTKIAGLINGAPNTLDTLKEIADEMTKDKGVVEALEAAVGTKADKSLFESHANDSVKHLTDEERTRWNKVENKADKTSIGSGTLTIKGNGRQIVSFSANQSSNEEVDITPSTIGAAMENHLHDNRYALKDSELCTATGVQGLVKSGETSWGNQVGSSVAHLASQQNGAIDFRENNPNQGKLSMKINGCFYQNNGDKRVLDESDKATLDTEVNCLKLTTEFLTEVIWHNMYGTKNIRTEERLIELNNSVLTVPLNEDMDTTDYAVTVEIMNPTADVGDIIIYDKQVNGFKVKYNGSAPSVQLKLTAQGGVQA